MENTGFEKYDLGNVYHEVKCRFNYINIRNFKSGQKYTLLARLVLRSRICPGVY